MKIACWSSQNVFNDFCCDSGSYTFIHFLYSHCGWKFANTIYSLEKETLFESALAPASVLVKIHGKISAQTLKYFANFEPLGIYWKWGHHSQCGRAKW